MPNAITRLFSSAKGARTTISRRKASVRLNLEGLEAREVMSATPLVPTATAAEQAVRHDAVGSLQYSPDGQHVAFVIEDTVKDTTMFQVIEDGKAVGWCTTKSA